MSDPFNTIGIECYRCGSTSGFEMYIDASDPLIVVTCEDCNNTDVWRDGDE